MANLGSEDDDGNAASKPTETPSKIWLNPNTKPFDEAIAFIKKGGTIEQIKTKYSISKINEELLINQSK
jgi:ABC-type amino acid transport substrate-binding protein